jgi:hypothetical protein
MEGPDEALAGDAALSLAGRRPGQRLLALFVTWHAWAAILVVWTGALLSARAPQLGRAVLPDGWMLYAGKGLHVFAYASLAAAVCWLHVRRYLRVTVWLGLVGHGALTEFLQRFVEGRQGSLADVGLDAGSVVVGLTVALAWRNCRARSARTAERQDLV